jgi:hypothetical protein
VIEAAVAVSVIATLVVVAFILVGLTFLLAKRRQRQQRGFRTLAADTEGNTVFDQDGCSSWHGGAIHIAPNAL